MLVPARALTHNVARAGCGVQAPIRNLSLKASDPDIRDNFGSVSGWGRAWQSARVLARQLLPMSDTLSILAGTMHRSATEASTRE